ncbi:SCY1-like protein 2 [Schistocerca nitens]|uniref:SCY1-like protein 2 n=1 Tax=Schistocerca nitens TaxID=7011 RepID=UPI0021182CDF|nr:SCY1-like protein 2 [Schistocerca nitens]XP_049806249.1 SCY1-like protein 2 [Schistocerca nitens]XP_049806250.1 SCY1-like protein 2 [Schistocerca nitens]XP_049806251.1 SCY1-like protein 2 [Schistocerca nitens]XP_049806252.1 SCY1-like protein 2 [Schistocerca nitens]
MDVINKLYSTVSTTVSQLSGVLPGNPVTREYEITSYTCTAGPSQLWKVYKGYKKSTKQDGSIFVFEKRTLERCSKMEQERIMDLLRRGVFQLTRLRHPQILTVQHPLEESRESLAFAAEPVFTSLAELIKDSSTASSDHSSGQKGAKLYEVEIKHGLVQIGEGLVFLHNNVKLLHGNINPETILVNQQGAWKIFGFDFCILNSSNPEAEPFWPCKDYSYSHHPYTIPNLDYLAPEYALSSSCSPASDIYSVGQVIISVYNKGQPLFSNKEEWHMFEKSCSELKQLSEGRISFVPEGIRTYVKMMLNVTPEIRPDAHQFVKISYFEDVGVKTLTYLDSLFQWDNLQKSQFYKGLPQIIPTLPHRVSLHRILPCLIKEFVNPPMVPFVLPNVLLITDRCSREEYITFVLPHLKPVMKIQEPIQVLLIFMQKMELLLYLTPSEEIKNDVLPMIYRALESNVQQIQELCLSVLPTFAGLIDYPAMKNALLPRIKRLCTWTQHVSVRVNCLICIGKLLEHLDKWLVLDEVLPFLPTIPSRDPAVLMGILGIYKLALTHKKLGITKEFMANKILPFLMPLSIESDLTLNQFNAFMSVIKEMVNRVDTEHRAKLEQLHKLQESQRTSPLNLQDLPARSQSTDVEKLFSSMGIDSSLSSSVPGTSSPESKAESSNGSSKSLSLEEKQSIAQQQELQQRLQAQPVLTPSTVPDDFCGLMTKPFYSAHTGRQQPKRKKDQPSAASTSSTTTVTSEPFGEDFSGFLQRNLNQMDSSLRSSPRSPQSSVSTRSAGGDTLSDAFSSFQSADTSSTDNHSVQWSASAPSISPAFRQPVQSQQSQWSKTAVASGAAGTPQQFRFPIQQFPKPGGSSYASSAVLSASSHASGTISSDSTYIPGPASSGISLSTSKTSTSSYTATLLSTPSHFTPGTASPGSFISEASTSSSTYRLGPGSSLSSSTYPASSVPSSSYGLNPVPSSLSSTPNTVPSSSYGLNPVSSSLSSTPNTVPSTSFYTPITVSSTSCYTPGAVSSTSYYSPVTEPSDTARKPVRKLSVSEIDDLLQ